MWEFMTPAGIKKRIDESYNPAKYRIESGENGESYLSVFNVQRGDQGTYICKAESTENEIGINDYYIFDMPLGKLG